ncbi:MAG: OmpA family protein [Spirochaetales bacterium]|nr:OmpA family protein [Leptospiraceae bacterium]MCP5480200.1 OmpA family protein [Spirochaetales bacterium]MCP5486401.1 OmpA family protein [Spirochaetales bacterium]
MINIRNAVVTPILMLALAFFAGCVSASRLEEAEKQRDEAQARATDLEGERDELQSERDRLSSELERVQAELDRVKRENTAANQRLANLQQENADTSTELETVQQERTRLQQRIAELEGRINDLDARSRRLLDELRSIQRSRDLANQELDAALDELIVALEEQLSAGDLSVRRMDGMIRLSFKETALFSSGQAGLDARGRQVLANIATVLKKMPAMTFYVEGHTDSRGIGPNLVRRYPSNWELGAARAITVVRHLTEQEGIDASRMAAVSRGPHQPVAENSSATGRAQNRRIEITLLRSAPQNMSAGEAQNQTQSPTQSQSQTRPNTAVQTDTTGAERPMNQESAQ